MDTEIADGTKAVVTGWGYWIEFKIHFSYKVFVDQSSNWYYKNDTEASVILRGATVSVINQEGCIKQWEDADSEVTDGMICTGSGEDGRHGCQGDSGEKHIRQIFLH